MLRNSSPDKGEDRYTEAPCKGTVKQWPPLSFRAPEAEGNSALPKSWLKAFKWTLGSSASFLNPFRKVFINCFWAIKNFQNGKFHQTWCFSFNPQGKKFNNFEQIALK